MTHTLHRLVDPLEQTQDWILICKAANGINDGGAADKLRQFLRMSINYGAINCGHGRGGSIHLHDIDQVIAAVTDQSTVTAVYDDADKAVDFIVAWKSLEMGLSVTLSTMHTDAIACCRQAGIRPHSIKHAVGVWGATNRLPEPHILAVTTMCGHGLISPQLVAHCIDAVSNRRMTASEASMQLAKPCLCGIFNLSRCVTLLERLADTRCGR